MSDSGGAGRARGGAPDIFGPLERPGALRGWLLVAVVVAIGALLLPSATRPGLGGAVPASAGTRITLGSPAVPSQGAPATVPSTTSPATTTTAPPTAPLPSVAPSTIRVLVANGTNTNGAAGAVSSFLAGKGFSMLTPVNALTVVSASQVYAVGAEAAEAREVADALGLPPSSVQPASQPVPVASTAGAMVVVVVGPDLTSRA